MNWFRAHRTPIIFLLLFIASSSGLIWLWESGTLPIAATAAPSPQVEAQLSALKTIREENNILQSEILKLQEEIAKLGSTAASSSTSNASSTSTASPAASPATLGQININTATLAELDTLPGIGPSKAQAILDDRTANGAFRAPEELKRVKGIGDKTYETLAPYIRVE